MAKKKSNKSGTETRQYGTLMRVAEDVRDMAVKLAALEGSSAAEIVTEIARPVLEKRLKAAYRKGLEEKS